MTTIFPDNSKKNVPTIQGVYSLFDAENGRLLAQMDGSTLTVLRTAAASALASTHLSRADSKSLLMIGNGALAPELIKAHTSIRPIKDVWVWGRKKEKTDAMIASHQWDNLKVDSITNREKYALQADIISSATSAQNPVLFGNWCREGHHIDLVGSFQPDHREADDAVIEKCRVFIDVCNAMEESGDLSIPIKNGVLGEEHIAGTLQDLVKGKIQGRSHCEEITLFKSVGFAQEDLILAEYLYRQLDPK